MTGAQTALGAVILLPILAAAISTLLPSSLQRALGLFTATGTLALVGVIWLTVTTGEVLSVNLGGYDPPVGIMLRADGFGVLFLGLTAVVGAMVSVFAAADPDTPRSMWPLWCGCWSGLNAVSVAGDLFTLYVALELVGLTAVALVAAGGREAWDAALRYLYIAVLGSLLLLIGIGLIVAQTGTLDILQASQALALGSDGDGDSAPEALLLAIVLITVGLAMKVALLPLHAWLIPAHSTAPAAVSPVLSALVIKAALIVLLRCWLWLIPAGGLHAWEPLLWVVSVCGCLAVIAGSLRAITQRRLKPLVAYSTVAQVGYWFAATPLLIHGTAAPGAYGGVVAMALGHGVAKAALFLAAGHLKELYGSDDLETLRGAGMKHPSVVMGMGLSAVGLIGVPISLGFTGKWQIATSAVEAQAWWLLAVLGIGTLLAAGYCVKAVAPLLLEESAPRENASAEKSAGSSTSRHDTRQWISVPSVVILGLGLLTVLTGFGGVVLAELLEVGSPW